MPGIPLLGTWTLVAWYNETDDGRRFYPLGPDATGYISYSQDGYVFVQLTAAGRADFAVNDPFGATVEEDSAAMKSQISYSGTYEFRGDHVIHRVTHATCPNWVGTEQVRYALFRGDEMQLSAPGAFFQGRRVRAVVEWQRPVKASP